MIILVLIFTLLISILNSYTVGRNWPYAKFQGIWGKLLNISGFLMTGIGFSVVLFVIITFLGGVTHLLSPAVIAFSSKIYPALIIIPLVMSGGIIMIESWKAVFASNQSGLSRFSNLAGAGYNTYAEIENIISMPSIFKNLFDSDDDIDVTTIGFVIALFAIFGGFLIGYFLIKYFAKKELSKHLSIG